MTSTLNRLVLASFLAILSACPLNGRDAESNCAFDTNPAWKIAGISHHLSQPSYCPIQLAYNGEDKSYAATMTAPSAHITSNEIYTNVYDARDVWVGTNVALWFDSGNSVEADLAFDYSAGNNAPIASQFYDLAFTSTSTSYGDAIGTATLTYRIGTIVAIQGSVSPTPFTNATWSLSVANASAPFTYRWFKNDVELTDQNGSSLQLPVTTTYFTLKAIASAASGGADTLVAAITPSWRVTINGMSERSPDLTCPFYVDIGDNPSSSFTYDWTLDGTKLPDDGWSTDPSFSLGSHTLEVLVTDVNGYTAKSSMTVSVTEDGPSNCM